MNGSLISKYLEIERTLQIKVLHFQINWLEKKVVVLYNTLFHDNHITNPSTEEVEDRFILFPKTTKSKSNFHFL